MTASELLADGRLTEAIDEQLKVVEADPSPATRLFLFELLILSGHLRIARGELAAITSDEPAWPATRRRFRQLLRALRRWTLRRRPAFLLPPPAHARRRWNAARAGELGDDARGVKWADLADALTPEVRGFVDGREFVGLRDGDDRLASVFEVFVGSRYVWVPFEQVRAVVLPPAAGVIETVYRPAELRLSDGRELNVVLPLVYPMSTEYGDEYALGEAIDWAGEGNGPACAFGAKVYFVGEEELPLSQVRMIEFR
jgi:type VI secretion system protein ImpE